MRLIVLITTWFLLLGSAMPLWAETSEKNREASYLYFSLTPFGLSTEFLYFPVRAGLILGSSLVVGAEQGKTTLGYREDHEDRLNYTDGSQSYQSQGAFLRWFMTNSLNLSLGQFHRKFEGKFTTKDLATRTTLAAFEAEASLDVVQAGLGNMWTFDSGFFLGVDWVFLGQVKNYNKKITQTEGGDIAFEEDYNNQTEWEEEVDGLIKNGNQAGFAVLRVGMMF